MIFNGITVNVLYKQMCIHQQTTHNIVFIVHLVISCCIIAVYSFGVDYSTEEVIRDENKL